jgi:predicted RNase H-like HicB family nuclease
VIRELSDIGAYSYGRIHAMNYIYPAIFYPEYGGRYSVIFPDLNGLATYGDNLVDAFDMVQEVCEQYVFGCLEMVR